MLSHFSHVQLYVTPQDPLSREFSRQEYWSGLPCSLPGDPSPPRDRTSISCIAGRFFTSEPLGKLKIIGAQDKGCEYLWERQWDFAGVTNGAMVPGSRWGFGHWTYRAPLQCCHGGDSGMWNKYQGALKPNSLLSEWANSTIRASRCVYLFRLLPWPSDSSATLLDCTAERELTILKRLHCFYELALGDPSPFPLLRCVVCLTKCFWKQIIRHCRLWLFKEDIQWGCSLHLWLCEMSSHVKTTLTFKSASRIISVASLEERGRLPFWSIHYSRGNGSI